MVLTALIYISLWITHCGQLSLELLTTKDVVPVGENGQIETEQIKQKLFAWLVIVIWVN